MQRISKLEKTRQLAATQNQVRVVMVLKTEHNRLVDEARTAAVTELADKSELKEQLAQLEAGARDSAQRWKLSEACCRDAEACAKDVKAKSTSAAKEIAKLMKEVETLQSGKSEKVRQNQEEMMELKNAEAARKHKHELKKQKEMTKRTQVTKEGTLSAVNSKKVDWEEYRMAERSEKRGAALCWKQADGCHSLEEDGIQWQRYQWQRHSFWRWCIRELTSIF